MSDTRSQSPATPPPLETFFAGFAAVGFSYQPATSAQKNFARLCQVSGWARNSPARADAREGFKDALVQQFNFLYGVDGNDLAAWQNLCKTIGIEPFPDSIDECRKVGGTMIFIIVCSSHGAQLVWDAHVNIVDLIEAVRTGRPVRQFPTLDELAAYTKRTDRFFPKQNAYQGGLLKELLREIINPYFGKRRNGSQKRKARKARKREAAAVSSQS
ncbi:hypothetical protein J3R83DRAFT_2262 [Lanmaoa asiatica]|nr:hypothetical protein J3R83DRAFT_2262 [Lanmaoa asiatica]